MARKKETTTASTSALTLRKRPAEKLDYNINVLAAIAFEPPKAPKKAVAKVKKAKGKARTGPSYLVLVKRALKSIVVDHSGASIPAIVKHLERHSPEKADRRYVRLALAKGVAAKQIVQTRLSFRLSAKEAKKVRKAPKKTAKKTSTKSKTAKPKKTTTKKGTKKGTKKATTKKTTKDTKKTTKKATTNKATTKKSKKDSSTKSPAKKKAKTSASAEVRGVIAEGAGKGVWQYYDNGWHDYYPDASNIVEGIYQEFVANPNSGLDVRAVKSGHFQYSVDFGNLHQTNIETGTKRNIQRRLA